MALPVIVGCVLTLAAANRWGRRLAAGAGMLAVLAGWLVPARPPHAHDPGQGAPVVSAQLEAVTDGAGTARLVVVAPDCRDLRPRQLEARRAGDTRTAALVGGANCRYSGAIRLPDGPWFLYAEFVRVGDGEPVEGWVAVYPDRAGSVREQRELYRPAGGGTLSAAEVASGVVVYAVGLSLLAFALLQARRIGLRSTSPPA